MGKWFQRFSEATAHWVGTWWAFVLSVLVVVLWAVTGPLFNYSDTWQLVINTATTVITFWLVFIIQYTQNRDNRATHLKMDEIIHGVPEARNEMMSIESLDDKELEDLQQRIVTRRRRLGERR
jgi:low affinity Fe/Cu permease